MTPVDWRRLSLLLVALLAACENRDPLAPLFASSKGGPTVAAPTNLTATADSYHQIWLAWQDNATNDDGSEVYRSDTGPDGTFTLFTTYPWPNVTAGGNDGLQASTEYCYKVRAYKGTRRPVNYSDFSNVACATTLAVPVPAAPSGVHAVPDAWGRIRVTWNDNSGDESGFRVERSATSSGPWTSVGTTGPNVVSFDDRQPPAVEQPACYRVLAVNSLGASPGSDVACTVRPAAPSGLVATASGSDVDLTWTDNSGVEDGFQISRWTAQGGVANIVATLPANVTSYRDQGLPDDTYYYRVRATKDGGTSEASDAASALVRTMPPVAPVVDAFPHSSIVASVTWGNLTSETGYRVERSTDGGLTWVAVGSAGVNQIWFTDGGQPSEQSLCYRVIAFNELGESPPSNTDCTMLPLPASGLVATRVEGPAVDLTWTDNSGVEDGYEVALVFSCEWEECYVDYISVATLGPNTTSYRDERVYVGEYPYVVFAIKDGGRSSPSNAVP